MDFAYANFLVGACFFAYLLQDKFSSLAFLLSVGCVVDRVDICF
jgi:hypothetical protein